MADCGTLAFSVLVLMGTILILGIVLAFGFLLIIKDYEKRNK